MNPSYVSLALVEIGSKDEIVIETLSVTSGECAMSGAWIVGRGDGEALQNILFGKAIIALSAEDDIRGALGSLNPTFLRVEDFLKDAKREAQDALIAFDNFKSAEPGKRKNAVRPTFYEWPDSVDLNIASTELVKLGKAAFPADAPKDMQRMLSAARLLKYLIDRWLDDEVARANRKYIEGQEAEQTGLPRSWLTMIETAGI